MKLTKRESSLLVTFASLFAAIVGGGLLLAGVKAMSNLLRENDAMAVCLSVAESVLNERPLWMNRDQWLNDHTDVYETPEEASAALLNLIELWAQESAVTLTDREIVLANAEEGDEVTIPGYYSSATIRVTLSGTQEEVLSWIHELQKPGLLIGVTGLVVHGGDEFSAVVDATKWYFKGNVSS